MTTLPPEYALRQAATKLGFHVVAVPKGEALALLTIYPTPNDNCAILAWAQGTGIVRRMGLSWVACSLAEANEVMARCLGEKGKATQGSGEYSAPWVRQGDDGQLDPVRERDPLDDPRMGGDEWIWADMLLGNPEWLDAWLVWERWNDGCNPVMVVHPTCSDVRDTNKGLCQWRPLRLPGMNARGEIPASAMTEEHFERVNGWQMSCSLCRWTSCGTGRMSDVDDEDSSEVWRPAIFAKLDKEEL